MTKRTTSAASPKASLPPRQMGRIWAASMLQTLIDDAGTLTDEDAVDVFVGVFQRVLEQAIATNDDGEASLALQGFADEIGVILRRWALMQAVQAANSTLSPVVNEEALADLARSVKEDLGELVNDIQAVEGDPAAVDGLLQSAADGLVGFMLDGMMGAAEIGMDMGRSEEQAETGRLQ